MLHSIPEEHRSAHILTILITEGYRTMCLLYPFFPPRITDVNHNVIGQGQISVTAQYT